MPKVFIDFLTSRGWNEEQDDLAGLDCFAQRGLRFNHACPCGEDFCTAGGRNGFNATACRGVCSAYSGQFAGTVEGQHARIFMDGHPVGDRQLDIARDVYIYKYWSSYNRKTWENSHKLLNVAFSGGMDASGLNVNVELDINH